MNDDDDDLRPSPEAAACERLASSIGRAFDDAPELAPSAGDEALIATAVQHTLRAAAPSRSISSWRRFRTVSYLSAAAVFLGALAYAATYRATTSVAAVSSSSPSPSSPSSLSLPAVPVVAAPERPGAVVARETSPADVATITPEALPEAPPGDARQRLRPMPPARAVLTPPTAAELFARANEARGSNETERAVALHRELQATYPESREASTSRIGLGRLLLDRAGDAAGARSAFDAYLAHDPGGPLAEEAREGRALACMRLGDPVAERAAWNDLLAHHPDSVHAARARQRLVALAAPGE